MLHDQNVPIGVVTGLQGKKTYRVTVKGREAHVGTTPMRERQDALMASVDLIAKMSAICEDAEDLTRFSVGRFDLTPNAPSVIPAQAVFSIDLRHPDSDRLEALGSAIEEVLHTTRLSCGVSVEKLTDSQTTLFSPELMSSIHQASSRCNLDAMDLLSSAGHDSRWINYICPTAMIFIPSKDGISHHHEEYSSPEQLAGGASVLAEVIAELVQ
jgi:N-carbamoyl-L-amino-acid hydrolase